MVFPLLLALLTPAHADALPSPPTAAEVSTWSAVEYHDHLSETDTAMIMEIINYIESVETIDDEDALAAHFDQIRNMIQSGRAQSERTPPYQGDAALRNALLDSYDETTEMLREAERELQAIFFSGDVRDTDIARLEAHNADMIRTSDALCEKLMAVQADFAERHGYQLLENTQLEKAINDMDDDPLVVPDLLPEGSTLEAEEYIYFALRYHNQNLDRYNTVMDAWNAVMSATHGDPADIEAALKQSTERLRALRREARKEHGWLDDDNLRDSNLELIEATLAMMEGPLPEYARLMKKKRLKKKEHAHLDALVAQLNTGLDTHFADTAEAYEVFGEAWYFAEYEAHQAR